MKQTRRKHSASFKTKVVLESLKEQNSLQELSQKFGIHANQISTWKSEFINNASSVFESKQKKDQTADKTNALYKVIGQQKVEIDFLKQVLDQ